MYKLLGWHYIMVKVRTDRFQRYGRHVETGGGPFGCHPETPSEP
eukprot:COSAG01_NODE_75576_length_194_cov_1638.284211_1_plen_43_part_10